MHVARGGWQKWREGWAFIGRLRNMIDRHLGKKKDDVVDSKVKLVGIVHNYHCTVPLVLYIRNPIKLAYLLYYERLTLNELPKEVLNVSSEREKLPLGSELLSVEKPKPTIEVLLGLRAISERLRTEKAESLDVWRATKLECCRGGFRADAWRSSLS